jgi:hypothetical protein
MTVKFTFPVPGFGESTAEAVETSISRTIREIIDIPTRFMSILLHCRFDPSIYGLATNFNNPLVLDG